MIQKKSQSSRSSESSLKKAPLPPLPFANRIINSPKEKQQSNVTEEAFKIISDFKKKQEEIEKELDNLYRGSGMTPRELQAYLQNSNNFSQEEWERMQRERESLLYSLISEKEPKKGDEKLKTALTSSPQVPSSSGKERRKMQRNRRNWIPIR